MTGCPVTSKQSDRFSRYSKWPDTFRTALVCWYVLRCRRNFLPPSSRQRTVTYTEKATFKSPLRYWSAGVRFHISPTTHSLKQQWLHTSIQYICPQPSYDMIASVTLKRSHLHPSHDSQGREIFTHELRVSYQHRIRITISSHKPAQRKIKHSSVGFRAPPHTMPFSQKCPITTWALVLSTAMWSTKLISNTN